MDLFNFFAALSSLFTGGTGGGAPGSGGNSGGSHTRPDAPILD